MTCLQIKFASLSSHIEENNLCIMKVLEWSLLSSHMVGNSLSVWVMKVLQEKNKQTKPSSNLYKVESGLWIKKVSNTPNKKILLDIVLNCGSGHAQWFWYLLSDFVRYTSIYIFFLCETVLPESFVQQKLRVLHKPEHSNNLSETLLYLFIFLLLLERMFSLSDLCHSCQWVNYIPVVIGT